MPETSSAWEQGLKTRRARTCVYGVECIFRAPRTECVLRDGEQRRGNGEGPGPAASNGLYLRGSPPPGEKSDKLIKLPDLFSFRDGLQMKEAKDVSRRGKDRHVQVWSEATCEEWWGSGEVGGA